MARRDQRQLGVLHEDMADDALLAGGLVVGGLFPTPIVTARVAQHAALNAALTSLIMEHRAMDPGVSISNVGGWHSTDFLPWSGPSGHMLIDAARHVVARMTLMEAGRELVAADVAWRVAAWANVTCPGESHRHHAHPGAFWSGVYWIDDGGAAADASVGGLLEFQDPRGMLASMVAPHLRVAARDCLSAGRAEAMTPEAGSMVVFPSWLTHSVTPYCGERQRLSVAFNFSL